MDSKQIAHLRLINQQLTQPQLTKAADLVSWMGCIQSQDFAGAKWAIANRVQGLTDLQIEADFNAGKILRTHILRPTWHFVCPEDIGWMLQLTAPHIKAMSKSMHKQLDINQDTLNKSKDILIEALTGNKHLTRQQLLPYYAEKGINTDDIRLGIILMDAELDGLICSGAKQGKQFTHALLHERVKSTSTLDREAAIAELAKRYFYSHGPATLQDFAWWSGLNLGDSKHGLAMNKEALASEIVNGQTYWFYGEAEKQSNKSKSAQLLPAFDEYTVAYKDRSSVLSTDYNKATGNGIFKPLIIIDGQVAGIWKRSLTKNKVIIDPELFKPIDKRAQQKLMSEARRFGKYLGLAPQVNGFNEE
ncbi:winged helix DNA-binding domain-containing protein [Mucilaginibacter jinjuensis]|uniref:Winged helix DNA-binding domain-containing protein n=1 Tax=Mucilaginibacter jinjuensis TaxID=1176721 RepID=A0ABY7TEP8_9SPHI|nr:winged helix DNA-binding domain-containing protein [Mucilaginibacter jinjuensis]WCT14198.1 winged helix DNA-binding domain-containing protein [Mucilaginibacter jinjuensis]